MNFSNFLSWMFVSCSSVLLVSCLGGSGSSGVSGSSQSGAGNLSSISQLPDTSEMIVTSESGAALLNFAVTGTPPRLSAIGDTELVDALDLFWPGLNISSIADGSVVPSSSDPDSACFNFWGSEEDADAPGGFGACFMAQQVGYSFENILQAGGSFCYMKGLPSATDPALVTAVGDNADLSDPEEIFDQQAADRTVEIDIQGSFPGEESEGESAEKVYIKVHGTNSVGNDVYKVTLWFCKDDGGLDGYEEITVNKSSGLFSSTSVHDDDFGASTIEVTAFLKEDSEGDITFDEQSDRLASMSWGWSDSEGGASGEFKTELRVTSANRIFSKTFETQTFQHDSGDIEDGRKAYSVSEFQFSEEDDQKVGNIRFLQAAIKDVPVSDFRQDGGFNAAVEYRSDGYYSAPDSSLRALLDDVDFDTDSFYTTAPDTSVTLDTAEYPCESVDVDYQLVMDLNDADVIEVAQACDGDRLENMDFCWSDDIRDAESAIFSACTFE